jgi:Tfp pilus assembly protein PilN
MKNPFLKPTDAAGSFLPQDYVARKNELRANLICLSLFGVVMFAVIAAFFVTNRQWLQVKAEQEAVTLQYTQEGARIEQFKRLEAQKLEMMEKAETTTALLEKVPRSKLISELVTRMPADITLLDLQLISKRIKEPGPSPTSIHATASASRTGPAQPGVQNLGARPAGSISTVKAGPRPEEQRPQAPRFDFTLKLTGVAKVNNNIADYIQALKASPILENVDMVKIDGVSIEKLDLRKFQIEATIRKDADARGMETIEDLRAATSGGLPGDDPKRAKALTPDKARKGTAAAGGKED